MSQYPATMPPSPAETSNLSRFQRAAMRVTQFGEDKRRIVGIDLARGLAIFGMILTHAGVAEGGFELLDPTTWNNIAHGRSAVLFALLAGVSISIVTGRSTIPPADQLLRLRMNLVSRGAFIFIVGLALEVLNSQVAVILCVYGVLYVALLPCIRWSPKKLFTWALIFAVASPIVLNLLQLLFISPYGSGIQLTLFGVYPVPVWIAFAMAGMAIGRMPLTSVKFAWKLAGVGAVVSAVAYLVGFFAVAGVYSLNLDAGSASDESSSVVAASDDAGASDSALSQGAASATAHEASDVPGSSVNLSGFTCNVYADHSVNCYEPGTQNLAQQRNYGPETVDPAFNNADHQGASATASGTDSAASDGLKPNEQPIPTGSAWPAYPQKLADQGIVETLVKIVSIDTHSGGIFDNIGAGAFAIMVIGLCLLAMHLPKALRWVYMPIAATGSLPLSAYSLHTLILWVIGGPTGYVGGWDVLAYVAGGVFVFTFLWWLFVGRGPLERLLKNFVVKATAAQ